MAPSTSGNCSLYLGTPHHTAESIANCDTPPPTTNTLQDLQFKTPILIFIKVKKERHFLVARDGTMSCGRIALLLVHNSAAGRAEHFQ